MAEQPRLFVCTDLRVRAGSKRWLAARRGGIGASEIAAALGLSPYSSPTDLYYRKRGELPDERDNASMEWGRMLEDTILQRFVKCHPEFRGPRITGRLLRNNERPWQLATPDAVVFDTRVPFGLDSVKRVRVAGEIAVPVLVQVKTAHSKDEWGQERSDEIPLHYRCQVMQEMDVVGARVAWLPVLFRGREYREYRVEYNQRDVDVLRARGAEFWQRVVDGNPPPPDAHRATASALRARWGVDPDARVQVPRDLLEKWARVRALGERIDGLDARYEARLRALMGEAGVAMVGTAVVARRSTYARRNFDIKTFRQDHPDLAEKYTTLAESKRLSITTKELQ